MVITDVNQVVYQGDGATTAFPFTFRIIDATDIKLLLIDADGTETDITSDYFVDTNTNTVYYPGYAPGSEPAEADQPAPVQEGQRLVVYRELPVTQEKDLGDKWPFFVIELALDKLTMLIQQVKGIWDRCLKVSVGQEATAPDFDYTVPIEAGKTFRVKDDGTGFELTEDPAVAHAAAVAAQEAAERAQGAAEDARDDADEAAENAEAALDLIKEKATWFDNVAAMKAAAGLQVGMLAGTKGYYAINDGGASTYAIRARQQTDVDSEETVLLDNGLTAEKIKQFKLDYSNKGWFKFGVLDKPYYCNGLATDGTDFYLGYGFHNTTGTAYVAKYDSTGKELARYTSSNSNAHFNSLSWNNEEGCLYALETSTTILKMSGDLVVLDTISLDVAAFAISYDPIWKKSYTISSQKIREYTADYSDWIADYIMPFINVDSLTQKQDCMAFGGHFFLCVNYPNTIIEYELISGKQIKITSFEEAMDSTYLGEIEGVCAKQDADGTYSIYVSFACGTPGGYYYNTIFALEAPVADLAPFPVSTYRNMFGFNNVTYYVDSTSTAYAKGSQAYPWKSLVECLMHTAEKSKYTIYVINADSTIDVPASEAYAPAGTYMLYMQGSAPGRFLRFRDSFVTLFFQTSNAYEFSVVNCVCNINTNNENADSQALIVTARQSHVTITGDVRRTYNIDSTINIKGTATELQTDTGNLGYNLVNDNHNIPLHSKFIRVPKGSTYTGAKLSRTSNWSSAHILLSISCHDNSGGNALFFINGYGAGGSQRTFVYEVPCSSATTFVTVTVDNSSNAVIINTGNSYDYFINVIVLNPDDFNKIKLELI